MWYEEVGSVTNDDLDTLRRGIESLMGGSKLPKVIYDVVSTGIGFIPHPAAKVIAGVVSIAELGWSLFGHSPEEELGAIRVIVDEIRYKYKFLDCLYKVSLLFGSHSNEFKIEVYGLSNYYEMSYIVYGDKFYSNLLETVVFEFRWNGIYEELKKMLSDMGVPLYHNEVEWKYSYK